MSNFLTGNWDLFRVIRTIRIINNLLVNAYQVFDLLIDGGLESPL